MRPRTLSLAALALLLLVPAAGATPPPTSSPPADSPAARVDPSTALDDLLAERTRSELAGPPTRMPVEWEDDATRAAYLEAARAYYAYRTDGLDHRRRVFAWQLTSSKVIFWVVVLLVLAGVYFSGVQFHATLQAWKAAAAGAEPGDVAKAAVPGLGGKVGGSEEGGFKVSSPVLGVLILALSFLFFYLYIVHVHPIQEIL